MCKMFSFPNSNKKVLINEKELDRENRIISNFVEGKTDNGFEEKYASNQLEKLIEWLES